MSIWKECLFYRGADSFLELLAHFKLWQFRQETKLFETLISDL